MRDWTLQRMIESLLHRIKKSVSWVRRLKFQDEQSPICHARQVQTVQRWGSCLVRLPKQWQLLTLAYNRLTHICLKPYTLPYATTNQSQSSSISILGVGTLTWFLRVHLLQSLRPGFVEGSLQHLMEQKTATSHHSTQFLIHLPVSWSFRPPSSY